MGTYNCIRTKQQMYWLLRAIAQIRRSTRKRVPVVATQAEYMPNGMALMFAKKSENLGMINLFSDAGMNYIDEADITKGLDHSECRLLICKKLRINPNTH